LRSVTFLTHWKWASPPDPYLEISHGFNLGAVLPISVKAGQVICSTGVEIPPPRLSESPFTKRGLGEKIVSHDNGFNLQRDQALPDVRT